MKSKHGSSTLALNPTMVLMARKMTTKQKLQACVVVICLVYFAFYMVTQSRATKDAVSEPPKANLVTLDPAQLQTLKAQIVKDPQLKEFADRNLRATLDVKRDVQKNTAVQKLLLKAAEDHTKFDRLLQDKVYVPEAEPLLKKREEAVRKAQQIEKGK